MLKRERNSAMQQATGNPGRFPALCLPPLLFVPLLAGCTPGTDVTVVSRLPYSVEVYEQSPTLDHLATVVPPFGTGKTFWVRRGQPFRLRFQRDDGRLIHVHYHAADTSGPLQERSLTLAITPDGVTYPRRLPTEFRAAPETSHSPTPFTPLLALIAGGGWGLVLRQRLYQWSARRQRRTDNHVP
jgi:hypothetical protein